MIRKNEERIIRVMEEKQNKKMKAAAAVDLLANFRSIPAGAARRRSLEQWMPVLPAGRCPPEKNSPEEGHLPGFQSYIERINS